MRETPTPQPKSIDWARLNRIIEKVADEIASHFDNTPFNLSSFLKKKRGRIGQRYKRAVQSVLKDGFDYYKDSKISLFVKNEAYLLEEDTVKKPRCIMGRDPKFNLFYAAYVEKFEEALGCCRGVTCCMDHQDVGRTFRDMQDYECMVKGDDNVIKFPWGYIEGDATSYESSQRLIALAIEYNGMWRVFDKCNYGNLEDFEKLFCVKTLKRGESLNGLKFEFEFCRGSGDLDTTCGNTFINKVTTEYFSETNIGRGPNELINTYAYFGIDAKLECRFDYHDVGYCSGKFIKINHVDFMYVQDLNKLLRRIQLVLNDDFLEHVDTYYYSLGYMYSVLYANIPIYKELASYLMTAKRGKSYVETAALESHYGAHNAFIWHKKRADPVYQDQHSLLQGRDILTDFSPERNEGLILSELMLAFDMGMPYINALQNLFSQPLYIAPQFCKHFKPKRGCKVDPDDVNLIAAYVLPANLPHRYQTFKKQYATAKYKFRVFLSTEEDVVVR